MVYSGSIASPSPFGPQPRYFKPRTVTFDPVRSVAITPEAPAPTGPRIVAPITPTRRAVDRGPDPATINATFNPLGRLNAEAVRATGPDQSAYAQNLATYAGGLFNRNNGSLLINPFGRNPFATGQRNGLGNSPLAGTPGTLMDEALGRALTSPQSLDELFPGFAPASIGF